MERIVGTFILTVALSSCSGMSSSDMNFMDRTDIMQMQGTENIDEMEYTDYNVFKPVKTLGSVAVTGFDDVTGEKEITTIDLKRNKSRFYAETQLFESENKDKTMFDETMVNFGVDKKSKGVNVELSLKF